MTVVRVYEVKYSTGDSLNSERRRKRDVKGKKGRETRRKRTIRKLRKGKTRSLIKSHNKNGRGGEMPKPNVTILV